ncbi:LPS export ABC transporter periplasmic protein LptC [Novosphingobium sp. M1R2S20]|uniref:LPS export ABC transporter periplasmic protein LptC n=1 Tax=Novosphingobium rhizovicinum TaxID=3228928 RepID=A0ABV3R907_9SPHN
MSLQATQMRTQRRQFAAPGGRHDRMIAFLAKALPAAIGLVVAVMILLPLSPRGEISFLLDRNKVAITNERVQVADAAYRGADGKGRPFLVTAGNAVQRTADVPVVQMNDLVARLKLQDGPAEIRAPSGAYNYDTEKIAVDGPVDFTASDGYQMRTQNVAIDIRSQTAVGSGGVSGAVPTGTFRADRIVADLENRTVKLEGNARLRMTPGKLRIPQ